MEMSEANKEMVKPCKEMVNSYKEMVKPCK